jgi:hypothetical protein
LWCSGGLRPGSEHCAYLAFERGDMLAQALLSGTLVAVEYGLEQLAVLVHGTVELR